MTEHELTAGIEVHQQLDTAKLFCRCPSIIRDDKPDFTIDRRLRASAGEGGETDRAASLEAAKAKRFRYQGYRDTTCLVELDEEPVSSPNADALHLARQVAAMLDVHVVDEVHVMRKTVVDGSNTSGFQRTMLIGRDGHIEVQGQRIRIEQLCLEEDSCKLVERRADADIYNLSRLGIPLLEITTGPDLHTPEAVVATAAHIGMLLRSTERVKRGLGTIRQDVNVSVPGGARVEIKGAQDLDSLGLLVRGEAQRQRVLINLAKVIPAQAYTPVDVTPALISLGAGFIAKALAAGDSALGIRLTGWRDALEAELMPGHRLGRELAGYAKASGFGGLIHSAEDFSKYGFTTQPDAIRKLLGCSPDDAWLFLLGNRERLLACYDTVLIPRFVQLTVGVPSEVRKAEADGTTTYLRPMPGAARMYPETDVRPIALPRTPVAVPELISHRAKRLGTTYSLAGDVPDRLAKEGLGTRFESWVKAYPALTPSFLATVLLSKEGELKTRHSVSLDIHTVAPPVLALMQAGTIGAGSLDDALLAYQASLTGGAPFDAKAFATVDDTALELVVQQLVRENPGASMGLLMGKVMRHFQNRADGKKVQALLRTAGVQ